MKKIGAIFWSLPERRKGPIHAAHGVYLVPHQRPLPCTPPLPGPTNAPQPRRSCLSCTHVARNRGNTRAQQATRLTREHNWQLGRQTQAAAIQPTLTWARHFLPPNPHPFYFPGLLHSPTPPRTGEVREHAEVLTEYSARPHPKRTLNLTYPGIEMQHNRFMTCISQLTSLIRERGRNLAAPAKLPVMHPRCPQQR